jgi:enoyl-CoA hydratase/carnithine racemase
MSDSEPPRVLVDDLTGGVLRMTLNRPAKRNAMDFAARKALVEALDTTYGHAKVIILTGTGTSFCAGMDLKEVASGDAYDMTDPMRRRTVWTNVQHEIRSHPAVVIAAVNGFALGGGVTLINTADLAIAANEASIGMPEASFGLYPGVAGPSTQLRLLPKHAAWMVLTAARIDGSTAEAWGLVNRSVPLADLNRITEDVAHRIAAYDAVTLEWCKRSLQQVPGHIPEWRAALEYGESVGTQIRARTAHLERELEELTGEGRHFGREA